MSQVGLRPTAGDPHGVQVTNQDRHIQCPSSGIPGILSFLLQWEFKISRVNIRVSQHLYFSKSFCDLKSAKQASLSIATEEGCGIVWLIHSNAQTILFLVKELSLLLTRSSLDFGQLNLAK